MSTLQEIINYFDGIKKNKYSSEVKVELVSNIDGNVRNKVLKRYKFIDIPFSEGMDTYTLPDDLTFESIDSIYYDKTLVDKMDLRGYGATMYDGKFNLVTPSSFSNIRIIYLDKFKEYRYIVFTGAVTFANNTITAASGFGNFAIGDSITITGCATYTQNNITAVITEVSDKTLTFADGTFTAGVESAATITRVLNDVVLLSGEDKEIYYSYMNAMIDKYNKDIDSYNNNIKFYNALWDDFVRKNKERSPVNPNLKVRNIW